MPTKNTQPIEKGSGIARDSLPQIPKDKMALFLQTLRKHNVSISTHKVPAKLIKPLQANANKEKLKQMQPDVFKFAEDYFIVSKELYLLDGHHRWLILKGNNKDFPIKVIRVHLSINQLLKLAHSFSGSHTENDDAESEKDDSDGISLVAKKLGVDPDELKKGMEVEKEHIDTIKFASKETSLKKILIKIALDHLKELPDYYTRLDQMENK